MEPAPVLDERSLRERFDSDLEPAFDLLENELQKLFSSSNVLGGGRRLHHTSYWAQSHLQSLNKAARYILATPGDHPVPHFKEPGRHEIYELMLNIAHDLEMLTNCLHDFDDHTTEIDDEPLVVLRNSLQQHSSRLKYCNFSTSADKLVLLSAMRQLSGVITRASRSLKPFSEYHLPAIRAAQKVISDYHTRMQVIMVFFSGVTITGIQCTFQRNSTTAQKAVNLFWLMSLALSVSSILAFQFTLMSHSSSMRSPKARSQDPFTYTLSLLLDTLVMLSVGAFIVGLVIFSWSSQPLAVAIAITAVTSCLVSFLLGVFASTTFLITRDGNEWDKGMYDCRRDDSSDRTEKTFARS